MSVNVSTGFRARLLGPQSFEQIFGGGCIEIRSGVQPEHADMAVVGTLLGRITSNGAEWTEGSSVNGLTFNRAGHRITNPAAPPWLLDGLATGMATWFRLRGISDPGTLSTSAPRIDGAIGYLEEVGDFQMRLPTTAISASTTIPIESWWFVFPPLD